MSHNGDQPTRLDEASQEQDVDSSSSASLDETTANASDAPAKSSEGEEAPAADPGEAVASEAQAGDEASGAQAGDEASAAQAGDEASAAQAGDEASAAQAGDEAAGAQAGDEAAGAQAGDEAAAGRRKRKRRRKKKRAGATTAGGETASDEAQRAPSLARFFSGAPKRHAFAVGEIVAGRVVGVDHGAIVVDLFGKATAVAHEHEPREVPIFESPSAVEGGEGEQSAPTGEPTHAPQQAAAGQVAENETDAAGSAAGSDHEADRDAVELETVTEALTEDAASTFGQPSSELLAVQATTGIALTPEVSSDAAIGPELTAGDASSAASGVEPGAEGPTGRAASEASSDVATTEGGAADAEPVELGEPPEPERLPEQPAPKLGAIFKGRVGAVAESGHIAIVNRSVDLAEVRQRLQLRRQHKQRVEGVVFGFNRGGFDVLVEGIRAFCPVSGMALGEVADPHEFVGQRLEFSLAPLKSDAKDVIVSRRTILEKQHRKQVKEFLRTLEPGRTLTGKVTQVREFGLFVDIGGVEGLVHQSELSHAFGVKPEDVAKRGDEVQVQVLKVGQDPNKSGKSNKKERYTRVSLSMKALQPDPWDEHKDVLAESTVRVGKVTRLTDFGAFIQLAPAVEGLLHISELGKDLKHASQALKEGEDVHVVVERVDRKQRRISLSKLSGQELQDYKEGKLDVAEAAKRRSLKPGSRITVTIDRAEHRSLSVRVAGAVGKRARGFIPLNELGSDRSGDHRKQFPSGTELEVKIIGIERDGSLRCSRKALLVDEERQAVKEYRREASKQGFGTFGDLLKAKLEQASK